jgi:hypothetical protein
MTRRGIAIVVLAADMPNQSVHRDGTLRAHVLNTLVTLSPSEASLLDADGSAHYRARRLTAA